MGDTTLLSEQEIKTIPYHKLPIVVLSDSPTTFVGWGIKHRTGAFYHHAMMMLRPGLVASQDLFFKEYPVDYYLERHRLKLWMPTQWSDEQKDVVRLATDRRLNDWWWRRLYDFKGIIGQWTGLRWLQSSRRFYCSEEIARVLRLVEPDFDMRWPTPGELNEWFKTRQDDWVVYGRFDPDVIRFKESGGKG